MIEVKIIFENLKICFFLEIINKNMVFLFNKKKIYVLFLYFILFVWVIFDLIFLRVLFCREENGKIFMISKF